MKQQPIHSSLQKALFATLFLFMACGCSKKEDIPSMTLNYDVQDVEVVFWSSGQIDPPNVDGATEPPTFSLQSPLEGLEIEPSTGALTWSNLLGIGHHEITVVAQNKEQEAVTAIRINSHLGGTLWQGGQNNQPNQLEEGIALIVSITRELNFIQDGTANIAILDNPGSEGVGVWAMESEEIEFRLCYYCPGEDPFSVPDQDEHILYKGVLTNHGAEGASISGQWFRVDVNPDVVTLRGLFFFRLHDELLD